MSSYVVLACLSGSCQVPGARTCQVRGACALEELQRLKLAISSDDRCVTRVTRAVKVLQVLQKRF